MISNQAVSDVDDVVKLYVHRKRVEHSIEHMQRENTGFPVQTIRLDSVVRDRVDLVKVDVEGAEWRIVRGAKASIQAGKILRWVIEVDDWKRLDEFEQYLRDMHYMITWLDKRHLYAYLGNARRR